VDLTIDPGERVCLVGYNGSGKSTLLKVAGGQLAPDEGQAVLAPGVRIGHLTQEVPENLAGDVFDVTAGGLGRAGDLLAEYHHLTQRLAAESTPGLLKRLEVVQRELESTGAWELKRRVETVLSRLKLPPSAGFDELSGGNKRQALLARALVSSPELLLLDEPTNHLDVDAIRWLEDFLLERVGGLLFVTHDRSFLKRLATRIVELDRGHLTSWPGDYATYLKRRQSVLDAELAQQASLDRRLAKEEAWIRQGIKARRTRNEGRVRALEALRRERLERRSQVGTARMQAQEADPSGKLVVEARGVTYGYRGLTIVEDLSTTVLRGDKVGIIGPNGCGKTTLIQILLGHLAPDSGIIRLGTRLEVAYFDQHRAQLDRDATVAEAVANGADQVLVRGKPRHIMGYLQDFLFPPDRARQPVRALSGGERNRLLLARLFARPSNLLVLDEPTNDLDMETLELLESLLVDYPGTLMLVSHDRTFLDNVVTSTLVFEGEGRVNEYVGGYSDWLRQRRPEQPRSATRQSAPRSRPPADRQRKLSYKEQRELEALPDRIAVLEEEQEALHSHMSNPAFYQRAGAEIAEARARLQAVEQTLEEAYGRWEELEELARA
jgi:ATP-binding cassette subfamily F protein uup